MFISIFQVPHVDCVLTLYLRLPSVHFHLTEVFPLGVPPGLFKIGLGNPPIDFLPRGFERDGVRSEGLYYFRVHVVGPMIGTNDLGYRRDWEVKVSGYDEST